MNETRPVSCPGCERDVTLGDRRPREVDVRILSATSRDLAAAVHGGQFRDDLYFRPIPAVA